MALPRTLDGQQSPYQRHHRDIGRGKDQTVRQDGRNSPSASERQSLDETMPAVNLADTYRQQGAAKLRGIPSARGSAASGFSRQTMASTSRPLLEQLTTIVEEVARQ